MRHLEYYCHMNRSGYAQAAQDYIFALKNSGYEIAMRLMHANADVVSMTSQRYAEIMGMIQKHTHPDAVQIVHGIPDKQLHIRQLTRKTIGFATFETYDPPEHWIKILNENSVIICPSKFNVDVFQKAGITRPIFHIPHCVDTTKYNPEVQSQRDSDKFTFMFFGTWKKRKGWEQLIAAWCKEFDASDNVRLVLKTDRIIMAQRGIEEVKSFLGLKKDYAPISFESKVLNEDEIPLLIKKADCLICPTLGEGFGLPGLQAMALGVPVVITNYSGCQDYANPETATLIEPAGYMVMSEMDKIPQFSNKKWAYIKPQIVAEAMRYVVQNTEVVRKKAEYASGFVAQKFSYEATVRRFDSMLDTL